VTVISSQDFEVRWDTTRNWAYARAIRLIPRSRVAAPSSWWTQRKKRWIIGRADRDPDDPMPFTDVHGAITVRSCLSARGQPLVAEAACAL
jgi:hypothetical protein